LKLKSARIRNFRCIREAEVNFDDMTSFIGGNGAGKSTVLRAIDAFYAGSPKITVHDYFNRKTEDPIEIDLTFHQLTEAEVVMFGSRVEGGELSVMRVFDWQDGARGRYFGTSLFHPDFAELRAMTGVSKRSAYGAFRVTCSPFFTRRQVESVPLLLWWLMVRRGGARSPRSSAASRPVALRVCA